MKKAGKRKKCLPRCCLKICSSKHDCFGGDALAVKEAFTEDTYISVQVYIVCVHFVMRE